MKRAKLRFIYENKNRFSRNQLAKNLKISKRELLDALKYLEKHRPFKEKRKSKIKVPQFLQRIFSLAKKASAWPYYTAASSPLRMGRRTQLSRNFGGVGQRRKKPRSKFRPRIHFWPIFLFIVAALIRIIYYCQIHNDPVFKIPILDAADYNLWAKKLAAGEPFRQTVYFTEPGYAYLLALIYKIWPGNYFPLIFIQFFLGCLVSLFVFLTAKELFGSLAGVLAGLAAAIFKSFVFYEALLLKASLEVFLVSFLVFVIVKFWEKKRLGIFFTLGFLIGVIAIIKANIIIVVPIAILGLLLERKLSKVRLLDAKTFWLSLVLVLGFSIAIAPVTYHNWKVGHDFVLLNYSGGPNIYIGNWHGADGTIKQPDFITALPEFEEEGWKRMAESYTGRELKPSEISRFWTIKSFEFALEQPGLFIKNTFRKLALLFNHREYGANYDAVYGEKIVPLMKFLLPFFLVSSLGVGAMLLMLKPLKIRHLLLYGLLLGYGLTLVASHVVGRYRLPLVPILIIFAGGLASWVRQKIREEEYLSLGLAAGMVLFFLLISFIPIKGVSGTAIVDMYSNFGIESRKEEEIVVAKEYLKKAIQEDPSHIWARLNLAEVLLLEGNTDEAIGEYQRAIRHRPDIVSAYESLKLAQEVKKESFSREEVGLKLEELKERRRNQAQTYDADFYEGMKFLKGYEFSRAIQRLEKAKEKYPEASEILANLATAYKNNKENEKAKTIFLEAIALDDYNLPAHYNLANLLSDEGDENGAIRHYERVNEVVSGFFLSRYYLAQLYAKRGDKQKAISTYLAFLTEIEEDVSKKPYEEKAKAALLRLMGR